MYDFKSAAKKAELKPAIPEIHGPPNPSFPEKTPQRIQRYVQDISRFVIPGLDIPW